MRLLADLIDAFARAEGPPPDRLWRFMRWALRGRLPGDRLRRSPSRSRSAPPRSASAAVVGWLIDLAQSRGPEGLIAESWPWLLARRRSSSWCCARASWGSARR